MDPDVSRLKLRQSQTQSVVFFSFFFLVVAALSPTLDSNQGRTTTDDTVIINPTACRSGIIRIPSST